MSSPPETNPGPKIPFDWPSITTGDPWGAVNAETNEPKQVPMPWLRGDYTVIEGNFEPWLLRAQHFVYVVRHESGVRLKEKIDEEEKEVRAYVESLKGSFDIMGSERSWAERTVELMEECLREAQPALEELTKMCKERAEESIA